MLFTTDYHESVAICMTANPDKHEKEIAIILDGKVTIGSGRSRFAKGDIKTPTHLVECKCTAKDYYTLNVKTWEKIAREASSDFREPLMAIRTNNHKDFIVALEGFRKAEGAKKSQRIKEPCTLILQGDILQYTLRVQTLEDYLENN